MIIKQVNEMSNDQLMTVRLYLDLFKKNNADADKSIIDAIEEYEEAIFWKVDEGFNTEVDNNVLEILSTLLKGEHDEIH